MSTTAVEWRLRWRRVGSAETRTRVFQRHAYMLTFIQKLRGLKGRAPLAELVIEQRPVGTWRNVTENVRPSR